ncbi:MAG: Fe-S cluster protein [Deltaproteobacteria bacterium HGW-Deltaproteobacteria-19]|nr:MAG: Fe-S cluster protein [Deltaproteobacteria bacterium HGW-Deltaproteobacteria-19]
MGDRTWKPPGQDCGLCGEKTCRKFIGLVKKGIKKPEACVFFTERTEKKSKESIALKKAGTTGIDFLGGTYDFVLKALPNEISARKIVMPFRPDLVEKWKIKEGDCVVGRPMSAGCPVQHVLQVIRASKVTGVLDTWCVGPRFSRGMKVHDVEAYVMLGFEGVAEVVGRQPEFGRRQRFLPGFCMMNIAHTGVVNMILGKSYGLHVRLEDIRFL